MNDNVKYSIEEYKTALFNHISPPPPVQAVQQVIAQSAQG